MLTAFGFLVLFTSIVCSSYAPDVPLFVWSGESFTVSNQNLEWEASDVNSFIDSLFAKTHTKTPEVIVLYLVSKLRTDEVARHKFFSSLKQELSLASYSVIVPYIDMDYDMSVSVVNTAHTVHQNGGSVIYLGKDATLLRGITRRVPSTEVSDITRIREDPIFSNGVTDLLIVHIERGDLESSELLDTIQSLVVEGSAGKYIALCTALRHQSVEDISSNFGIPVSKKRDASMLQASFYDNNNTNLVNISTINWFNRFFPGWFWEIFAIFAVFLSIVIFGTCQLNQIQVPDRLPQLKGKQKQ